MAAQASRTVQFEPFEFEPRSGRLSKNGHRIKLQPKSAAVLECLLECPGEIVSRERIQKRLWPEGTFVDFDLGIKVAVKKLRDALGDSAEDPSYIRTIPGEGYQFVGQITRVAGDAGKENLLSKRDVLKSRIAAQDVGRAPVVAPDSLPVPPETRAQPRSLYRILAVCVVLLTVAGTWVHRYISRQKRISAPIAESRIVLAVLPFSNLTGDANQEYVADGLTEELISELGRLDARHLGVIARTSAMAYKSTNKTVAQIGRELNAQYLLECSLREQGRRVRVSAQLIRTEDQTHIWARDYERDIIMMLDVEDDLAVDIAHEVKVQLTPEQRMLARSTEVQNPAAYDAYLQARFLYGTRRKESLFRARDLFYQAISTEPNYARAYSGLAEVYLSLGAGYMPSAQAYGLSRVAAGKALQLDDHLGEAHAVLGYLKFIDEWDWDGADREFQKALKLDPQDANAHQWYAVYLASFGRDREAIEQVGKALELDPVSISSNYNAGGIYCQIGRYSEAVEHFRRALELEPTSSAAHGGLALAYSYLHRYEDSLREYKAAQRVNGTLVQYAGPVALVYAQMGKRTEARQVLDELIRTSKVEHVPPYNFALAYVAVGDKEHAFYWLERAAQQREVTVTEINTDHRMDSLRRDARFSRLRAEFHLAAG